MKGSPTMLKKEEVLKKMSEKGVVVLNILPRKDFTELHIKGSENIPLTKDTDDFCREVVARFGKGTHFIVHGQKLGLLDSYWATRALTAEGLSAQNYAGGMLEWQRAGLPVEGSTTPD